MNNGEKKRKKERRGKMGETCEFCGHELNMELIRQVMRRRRRRCIQRRPCAHQLAAKNPSEQMEENGCLDVEHGVGRNCSVMYSTFPSALFTSHAHHEDF